MNKFKDFLIDFAKFIFNKENGILVRFYIGISIAISIFSLVTGEFWVTIGAPISAIIYLLFFLLFFLPAFIGMYFVSKTALNEWTKTLIYAFLVPFTNMIYYLAVPNTLDVWIECIGFMSLFFCCPIIFTISILVPPQWYPHKKRLIVGTILMFCIAIILIIICYSIKPSAFDNY